MAESSEKKKCPSCGEANNSQREFCWACYALLSGNGPAAAAPAGSRAGGATPSIFQSSGNAAKLFGGVAGFMALSSCVMLFLVGQEVIFLAVMAVVLALISITAWTYQCRLRIDPRSQTVEKSVTTLWWSKTAAYPFSDFEKVQILSGSGNNNRVMYLVHLTGSAKTCIPGTAGTLEAALAKAEQVAAATGKPLEKEPKIGFVLNLFERAM